MKTKCLPTSLRAAPTGILLLLVPLGFAPVFADAPPAAAKATKTSPTTHVLFMGANIAVEKDKSFHPVEAVTLNALVIKLGGKPVNVPLDRPVDLQINESLKITRTSVTIDGFKAERAYTFAADPFEKFAHAAAMRLGEGAEADLARGPVLMANSATLGASNAVATATNPAAMASAQQSLGQAMAFQAQADAALNQAYEAPMNPIYDLGTHVNAMGVEEGKEMFDAIRLSFEVTSGEDLTQPYYAVIAQIREPGSKPGQVRKWAYVRPLGPMNAGDTRRINVYRGGLPPGYLLEGCEVHLYDRNVELATNLSRKRVPLTNEEAEDYWVIEYIGANKGRTLPVSLGTTTLDGNARTSLTPAQLSQTCYVRVGKDGRVAGTFRDPTARQTLSDPPLVAALKTLRFKPALENGKPLESTVPITLARLASP